MESCATSGRRDVLAVEDRPVSIYTTGAPRGRFAGGGLISAILRRQSASVSCGPETSVPLTFVLYQPDTTPSRRDSSVLTWRGERFCMKCAFRSAPNFHRTQGEVSGCSANNHWFSSRQRAGQSRQVRPRPDRDDGCRIESLPRRINSRHTAPSHRLPPPNRRSPPP